MILNNNEINAVSFFQSR